MLEDWTKVAVPDRVRAALGLLEMLTLRPVEAAATIAEAVRDEALTVADVLHVGAIAFHFNLMNRLADAFDFAVPTGKQKARMARLLNMTGRHLGGVGGEPKLIRGDDGRVRPEPVAALRDDLLRKPGVTEPAVRADVDGFVRAQWQPSPNDETGLPDVVATYLRKLARHAYRIVDEDFAGLREAGMSDEAIYEVTATGAVASASVGLEVLCAGLHASGRLVADGPTPEADSARARSA